MKQEEIEKAFSNIIEHLDLDITDPGLRETPDRIARMYKELFSSLHERPPSLTLFPNEEKYDEIILFDNIPFTSMCQHHFLPFSGKAFLLYIPNFYIVGASKPARLIDYYCKLPQLQERLHQHILNHFVNVLAPKGAMLVMRATHSCMSCRGAKTGIGSGMTTSAVFGCFKENLTTKMEGLELIKLSVMIDK